MPERPTGMRQVSEEVVEEHAHTGSPRNYKWNFDKEVFNGKWWELDVPSTKVSSATNSFRNQCQAVYGTRATIRRGDNGKLYVRRLVDEPYDGPKKKGK